MQVAQPDINIQIKSTPLKTQIAFSDEFKDFPAIVSLISPLNFEGLIDRAPICVCLVVDRSGSMSGVMGLVIETIEFIISQLTSVDMLSIVIFDDEVEIVLPLTMMNSEGKENALDKCKKICSRNCTNLAAGLFQGLNILSAIPTSLNIPANTVRSLLLLTDGMANEGITNPTTIIEKMLDIEFIHKYKFKKNRSSYSSSIQAFGNIGNMFNIPNQNMFNQCIQQQCMPNDSPELYDDIMELEQQGMNDQMIEQEQLECEQIDYDQVQQIQQSPLNYQNFTQNMPPNNLSLINVSEEPEPEEPEEPEPEEPSIPKDYLSLPSVYTFGFSSDHDEGLLTAISEAGQGNYYFIEDSEKIGVSFVDCLGGLVSVVAQNITLTITAETPYVINKIKTKFKQTKQDNNYNINIGDLQSEERKDFLCLIHVPSLPQPLEQSLVLKAKLSYFNVLTKQLENSEKTLFIKRPTNVTDNSIDINVDFQNNRIMAANSMAAAREQGKNGNIKLARETITKCIDEIKASVSVEKSKILLDDLDDSLKGLADNEVFLEYGKQKMAAISQSHTFQRSNLQTITSYSTASRVTKKGLYSKK